MTDLAQHAAQVSIARNLHDPAFGFEGIYELHWFTPYALGTLVPLLFSYAFGVAASLKLTLSLVVLALPLALRLLIRETDGDPWWALTGFLVFFGHSFYWGFVPYLVALPLGVLFAVWTLRHRREPTWSSGVSLFSLGLLVFFAHGIVFAIMGATAGVLLLLEARTPRLIAIRMGPLVALLVFLLVWLACQGSRTAPVDFPLDWGPASAVRWWVLPADLVGGWTDPLAVALGWTLLAVLAIGMGLPRQPIRLVPLVAMALLYDLLPAQAAGAYFVFERTAVFVLVFALVGMPATASQRRRRICRTALSLLVLTWTAALVVRFQQFDAEARSYDVVMQDVAPRSRILALMLDRAWDGQPETYRHFPAWHQAEHGGVIGFSFAQFPVMVARYARGKEPLPFWASQRISWKPGRLKWTNYPPFDYYVVRSAADPGQMFQGLQARVRLLAHRDDWWVYETDKKTAR